MKTSASHPRPVTADHGVSKKGFLADTDISLGDMEYAQTTKGSNAG